jgi:methionine aminopeptidase
VPGDKKLKNGDIVNLDITTIKDGWHGDTSRMFMVGSPSIQAKRLVDITYDCMWKGIARSSRAHALGDIGHAIQSYAEAHGCSVVREFCGHGIGRIVPRRTAGGALRQPVKNSCPAWNPCNLGKRAQGQRAPASNSSRG